MKHKNFFYYNFLGLKLLFGMLPASMSLYCVLQIIHGISWMLQVVFMQYFFDTIEGGGKSTIELATSLLLMGGAFLFAQIMNGVANCFGQILNRRIGKEANKLIFRSIERQEVIAFESADALDRIHKAIRGSEGVFWVSTTILDILFFYTSYFMMMSWYLFSLTPILSISTIIIFIPNVAAKLLRMVAFEQLENEAAPLRRKFVYYEKCMTDKEYFKETRILGCCSYFKSIHAKLLRILNQLHFRAQLQKEKVNFFINFLTVLAYGGIIFLLVYYVMKGTISVGAFAAVLASLREFYGFMDEVISERFAWAAENVATVKNYLSFIKDADKERKNVRLPEEFEIKLEDVCFSYPQPDEGNGRLFALEHVDLRIPWGQTVALVGENGSGKSTLCNVIAGLYEPTQGLLSYSEVQRDDGRVVEGISAVFQKFCRYKMRLSENITISEVTRRVTEEELRLLCEEVGVSTEWTGGMDCMLGKEFGGTELSGGQWQRIAIPRGLFREKKLLILDEPTAAIDALEENNLYRSFQKMCHACTAIIVTHRLASAQIADRIIVMKDGKIVQDGKHEELIAMEGEYKRMYELQKKWYK